MAHVSESTAARALADRLALEARQNAAIDWLTEQRLSGRPFPRADFSEQWAALATTHRDDADRVRAGQCLSAGEPLCPEPWAGMTAAQIAAEVAHYEACLVGPIRRVVAAHRLGD